MFSMYHWYIRSPGLNIPTPAGVDSLQAQHPDRIRMLFKRGLGTASSRVHSDGLWAANGCGRCVNDFYLV